MIERARRISPELVDAVGRLVPVLSSGRRPPTPTELAAILADDHVYLLVARPEGGGILGMVALVIYDVPTGRRARIEDLVVAAEGRRQGVGEALMHAAMAIAVEQQAHVLDLTSNPSRTEANRLYAKLGFRRWKTNVFRKPLGEAEVGAAGDPSTGGPAAGGPSGVLR